MKVQIELHADEAGRLARLINSFRRSLSVEALTATWRNLGDPSAHYSLDDIMLLEDVRHQLSEAVEMQETFHIGSPYIKSF